VPSSLPRHRLAAPVVDDSAPSPSPPLPTPQGRDFLSELERRRTAPGSAISVVAAAKASLREPLRPCTPADPQRRLFARRDPGDPGAAPSASSGPPRPAGPGGAAPDVWRASESSDRAGSDAERRAPPSLRPLLRPPSAGGGASALLGPVRRPPSAGGARGAMSHTEYGTAGGVFGLGAGPGGAGAPPPTPPPPAPPPRSPSPPGPGARAPGGGGGAGGVPTPNLVRS